MSATPPKQKTIKPSEDLEIKDAHLIFNSIWETLEEELGHDNLRFPKEIILLGGAPGSGKGTQTQFILDARGFTCPPIVVSALLNTPEAQAIKNNGGMVGDREVIEILFRKMLEKNYRDGAILDGFPRTRTQVECMKMLGEKIEQLHNEFSHTPLAINFRKPTIHVMVLFITEKTSVARQIKRGQDIVTHNNEVEETGEGETLELRTTDLDPKAARRRYRVFKEQTWDALQSLKEIFHYHSINGEGDIKEVEQNIFTELQYQSSLELEPTTFDHLRPIPLASEIAHHARQELVKRLDSYALEHEALFTQIIDLIREKFIPIIERHALSGRATVNSESTVFKDPLALSMLIDVFTERGFHAVIDKQLLQDPQSVDLTTGAISTVRRTTYRIHIYFKGSNIRRG